MDNVYKCWKKSSIHNKLCGSKELYGLLKKNICRGSNSPNRSHFLYIQEWNWSLYSRHHYCMTVPSLPSITNLRNNHHLQYDHHHYQLQQHYTLTTKPPPLLEPSSSVYCLGACSNCLISAKNLHEIPSDSTAQSSRSGSSTSWCQYDQGLSTL